MQWNPQDRDEMLYVDGDSELAGGKTTFEVVETGRFEEIFSEAVVQHKVLTLYSILILYLN